MFPDTSGAGKHHADGGRWYINAFIEYLAGYQHRIFAVTESLQETFSFGTFGQMGQYREQKTAADGVSTVVVGGEYDNAFSGMTAENSGKQFQFAFAGAGDLALSAVLSRGAGFKAGHPHYR